MASDNETIATNVANAARIHTAADPVLCEECREMDLSFFDPSCIGCLEILKHPKTTISQIFAVIRQWVPQTQQNIDLFIKELFKRGVHVNDKDGLTDMTMLHYAAKSGAKGVGNVETSLNVVKYLIDQRIDIHAKCMWTDMTALHYAVFFDIEPVAELLLLKTNGAHVDSKCKEFDDGTALHIGCSNLCLASVKVLMKYGANPHYRNKLGKTPLDCIPRSDNNDNYVESSITSMQCLLKDAMRETISDKTHTLASSTLQALGLEMHGEVSVNGNVGTLRFCGPTDFASGQWAGIELNDPVGKNDGSVGGIRYFTCAPSYGIFAPLTRIYKHDESVPAPISISLSKSSSRTSSPLMNSSELQVDENVTVDGQKHGVIRYIGPTKFAGGTWVGVEVNEPCGKTNGTIGGTRYFECKPKHGIFAPLVKVRKTLNGTVIEGSGGDDITGEDTECNLIGGLKKRIPADGEKTAKEEIEPTISVSVRNTKEKHALLQTGRSSSSPENQSPKKHGSLTISPLRQAKKLQRSGKTLGSEIDFTLKTGMSVYVNNEIGTVRYIGRVDFAEGIWLGVELKKANGKNDGMVENRRYFSCKSNFGLMIRPNRASCRGINCAQLVDMKMQ